MGVGPAPDQPSDLEQGAFVDLAHAAARASSGSRALATRYSSGALLH